MRALLTAFRHLLAVVILPVTMTIWIPRAILAAYPRPLHAAAVVAGALVGAGGLALFAATLYWFATVGRGTLAPWDPTSRLVVTGIYRYVRNPMITGVLLILVGEAIAFLSLALAVWAATFFLLNLVHIPLVEEPGLVKRFGDDYREYRQNVPRWIPRFTPWSPLPAR